MSTTKVTIVDDSDEEKPAQPPRKKKGPKMKLGDVHVAPPTWSLDTAEQSLEEQLAPFYAFGGNSVTISCLKTHISKANIRQSEYTDQDYQSLLAGHASGSFNGQINVFFVLAEMRKATMANFNLLSEGADWDEPANAQHFETAIEQSKPKQRLDALTDPSYEPARTSVGIVDGMHRVNCRYHYMAMFSPEERAHYAVDEAGKRSRVPGVANFERYDLIRCKVFKPNTPTHLLEQVCSSENHDCPNFFSFFFFCLVVLSSD
jgi:hypothetical protein